MPKYKETPPPKDFTRCRFTLKARGQLHWVEGVCHRGLAVFGEPGAWQVVHRRSGMRISDKDFDLQNTAAKAIRAVADQFPWEEPIGLDQMGRAARVVDGILRNRPKVTKSRKSTKKD